MKKKIVFLAAGTIKRASSRFRVYWWIDELKEKGYDCEIITYYLEELPFKLIPAVIQRQFLIRTKVYEDLKKAAQEADIIIIQDIIPPKSWTKYLLSLNVKLILDFSNPIHLLNPNRNYQFIRKLIHEYFKVPRFNYLLSHCSAVIVENDTLKTSINHKNIHTISPINVSFFRPNFEKNDKFTLGWTGSPSTLQYVSTLFPIIEQLGEKYKIKLILIGAKKEVELKNVEVEVLDWDLYKEPKYVSKFDVGLFYLPNNNWGKSRGGGKLYVYMASGVPPIASSIGVGKYIVAHEKNGLHASTPQDFYNNIERLIFDKTFHLKLAKEARKTAEDKFSHKSYIEKYITIFNKA